MVSSVRLYFIAMQEVTAIAERIRFAIIVSTGHFWKHLVSECCSIGLYLEPDRMH